MISRSVASESYTYGTWPHFIMPSENTQSCDLYGPICQPGSITVAVNVTTAAPTITTLACSSYLSAQSYINRDVRYGPNVYSNVPPYAKAFGQSPECQSFLSLNNREYSSASAFPTNPLPQCDNSTGSLGDWGQYVPPGIWLKFQSAQQAQCCGPCHFGANEIRLLYFPNQNSTCPTRGPDNRTISSSSFATAILDSTTVYKGVTMTSPSIYIEVVGTATVNDFCGLLNPVLTDPIVAVNPGEITTVSMESVTDGQRYTANTMFYKVHYKTLNVDDLACPTFGIQNATTQSDRYQTFGPPYLPIVVPPPALLQAAPEWTTKCGNYVNFDDTRYIYSFFVPDPPIAMQPATALQPPVITTPPIDLPPMSTAEPVSRSTALHLSSASSMDPPPPSNGGGSGGGNGNGNGNGSGGGDGGGTDPSPGGDLSDGQSQLDPSKGGGSDPSQPGTNGPGNGDYGIDGGAGNGGNSGGGVGGGSNAGGTSNGDPSTGGNFYGSGNGGPGSSPSAGQIITIPLPGPQPTDPALTVITDPNGVLIIPLPTGAGVVIAGTTLTPGGSEVTTAGWLYGINGDGSAVTASNVGNGTGAGGTANPTGSVSYNNASRLKVSWMFISLVLMVCI